MLRRLALLAAVVSTVACTGGVKTKLCGGVGQPCCASAACDDGARCGGDNLCAVCGGQDQLCCAGDACNTGFTCNAHVCAASLVCPTQCTLGATQCSGSGGIETCVANGLCPEWHTVITTCPTGTSCVASATSVDCVDVCAGACTVSALMCTASGLQECIQGPADACPVLTPRPESGDVPLCVGGATADPDLTWESPTPFRAPIFGLASAAVTDLFVLDWYGNVVHDLLNAWTYELRPTEFKTQLALTDCGVPSTGMTAGESGSVFTRRGGAWMEEFVGQSVRLNAIACTTGSIAVAAGNSSRVFFRALGSAGSWTSVDTGVAGPWYGAALNASLGQAWVVGTGGHVVRCDGVGTASITCAQENVGTTDTLTAVTVHEGTGRVFVVGAHGTVISRGTLGTWTPMPQGAAPPTGRFNAVKTYTPVLGGQPVVLMVGDAAAVWTADSGGLLPVTPSVPATVNLTSLVVLSNGRTFAGDDTGRLWTGSFSSNSTFGGFTLMAGEKPIVEDLADVASAGHGQLFAVGNQGGRYRRENGAWTADNGGLTITTPLNGITAPSAAEVYAVGAAGSVYVRRAGQWSVDTTGQTPNALHDVTYDAQTLYAVGEGGAWLEKARTGGTGWHVVNHGLGTEPLWRVAVLPGTNGAADEVVAVGDRCTVLSKKAGAYTKLAVPQCTSNANLSAVTFTRNGGLLIGGEDGLFLQRLNGTSTFTASTLVGPDIITIINDLVMVGDTPWAVLFDGGLYERLGSSWRQYMPSMASSGLYSATYDSRDGLFAVGGQGLVWRRANPP